MIVAARVAGKYVDRCIGLDTQGNPLPAGRYTWKKLYHQPVTTRYMRSVLLQVTAVEE